MPEVAPAAVPTTSPAPAASPASAPNTNSPPAAAPVPEPTSAASPPAEDFSQLGEPDDDFVELPQEAPAPAEAAPADAPPSAVEPPKAPEPAKAPEPEPPKAPPAPEAPKEPAAAAAPPPLDPQALTEQLTQHRDALIGAIAQERFKLSPEEMNALEVDAVGTIPKLLARVYYESVQATLNHIQTFVPQMQASFLQAQRANEEAEKVFYGAFPQLDRAKHHDDVMRFAQIVRSTNPALSREDFIAMVGAAVMAKNGIALAANGKAPTAPNPKPAAGAPFVPAQAGATVRVTPEEPSPWAGLGADFED